MNRWTVVELSGGLGEHAAAWDELSRRLFKANPMLDSRFVDALLTHFGDGTERLCILRRGGLSQAMCVLKPRGGGVWATFLPAQAQIGPALIDRPDAVPTLLGKLPGINGQIDFLCNDAAFGDLTQPAPDNMASQNHALTMNVCLAGGFDRYWSSRSKKLVQNIGRYEQHCTVDNITSRFVSIATPEGMQDAVARYAGLESRGWKGKGGTALPGNNVQGAFYADVTNRFAQSGQAIVYELWFDDRLVASRIAIVASDTIVMLRTTYDESFNKYAPGRLLLRKTIEHAFTAHPGAVIEFYTNADEDQLAWATGHRWIRHVSFFRNAAVANLRWLVRAVRHVFSRNFKSPTDRAETVSVYRHPDELPPDVRLLFDKAEKGAVEFGVTWYRNLVNAVYPDHQGVRIYVLRHKGLPVAALPLLATRKGLWQNVDSLSNYYTAIYAPVVAPELEARDLVPLITAICHAHPSLASLRFAPMNPQSPSYRLLLEALKMAGLVPFEFFCFGNWFLTAGGEWSEYLKGRSGALRSTIKRMSKKFSADGGILELVQGGAGLERALEAYERVYAASWKGAEPFPNFVPGLARSCAERGWLRLGVAWLKDEPIAAQLWIVAGDKANIYKVAYHEDHKAYAPGTLLTAMLMQHVIEQDGVAEVDYLIGDDPYKKSWMGDRRERWGLIAYNPRSILGLTRLFRELGGRGIKYLKARIGRRPLFPASAANSGVIEHKAS